MSSKTQGNDRQSGQCQAGAQPVREVLTERLRRERILDAAADVVAERGVARASVVNVVDRAGVSRRAFYDSFEDGLQGCLLAVIDRALSDVRELVEQAFAEGAHDWIAGMRGALAGVLAYFDERPGVARVCLVETLTAGAVVAEHRDRALGEFMRNVVERIEPQIEHPSPLAAEATFASVIGVVQARLLTGGRCEPLIELTAPLIGVIVAPFVSQADADREIERAERLVAELTRARGAAQRDRDVARAHPPGALLAPRSHRARASLIYVANHPGASNRQVGAAIGVAHRGQIAKTLERLVALGLVVKRPGAPGHANAWYATEAGRESARALSRAQPAGGDRESQDASR